MGPAHRAHPPLGATAEVYHGVWVVITGNHVNRTAPSGWMVRLVGLLLYCQGDGSGLRVMACLNRSTHWTSSQ